jgi:hypothetical protein
MPVYRVARPKGFLAFRLSFLRIIARPDADRQFLRGIGT